jgi:type IV secretion system protein VirD4
VTNEIVDPNAAPSLPRRPLASSKLVPQESVDRQGFQDGDFWLGRSLNGKAVGWNEDLNLLTCAGPGAGKGVATVVPNLLMFPGSAIVVDPKGELATMTARHRRDKLGQKVIVLDPARTADVPDDMRGTYNPFDALSAADPAVVTAAETIASGLVVPNPKAPDPFWDHAAFDFITACILYMVRHYPAHMRTLVKLRQTIAEGNRDLFDAYVEARRTKSPKYAPSPGEGFEVFLRSMAETTAFGGLLQEAAAKLDRMGERTRGGVLATAGTHLNFLNAAELQDVLATPDDPARTFRLSQLRGSGRKLTVYVCLPVDMMPRQGRWFRVVLGQITQYMERTASQFDKSRMHPVLLMMDEFYQLGPIPTISNTLTFSRSSGLRLWLIVQDLNQLRANYPDSWETIVGACGIKQFFGINDHFTAEYVSKLLGDQEIEVPSISITRTSSTSAGTNRSRSSGSGRTSTEGTSESSSIARSESQSSSATWGTNQSRTEGNSSGMSATRGENSGESASLNRATVFGNTLNTNQSHGGTTSRSSGQSNSVGANWGQSSSTTTGESRSYTAGFTHGTTETSTTGRTHSKSVSQSESTSTGENESRSNGTNYGVSMQRQARRLFRPEEVIHGFTRDNLTQLVHVRDQGGMLLFRTPFYMDPALSGLLSHDLADE